MVFFYLIPFKPQKGSPTIVTPFTCQASFNQFLPVVHPVGMTDHWLFFLQNFNHNSVNICHNPAKICTKMCFIESFMCTKFQHDQSMRLNFMLENTKCAKKKRRGYFKVLLTHISDSAGAICFKIWYVDSLSSGASQQQVCLNLGKRSQSYIHRCKNHISVFLCQYTYGVAQWLLGPHSALLCVLIYNYEHFKAAEYWFFLKITKTLNFVCFTYVPTTVTNEAVQSHHFTTQE